MQIQSTPANREVKIPRVITTVMTYSSQQLEKNFQEKMVNRLCNKFPGMILPERQSAQLVLFHINHEKPSKFKASREHRKQDKISIFSRNKII